MNHYWLGIGALIFSQLCFALMDCVIKTMGQELPLTTILFFRNVVALAFIAPFFLRTHQFKKSLSRLHLHAMRSLTGLIAMWCIFKGVTLLPLAEATVLRSISPLVIPIIAYFWLDETFSKKVYPCIIMGFIGVFCIVGGAHHYAFNWYMAIPILGGIFTAFAMVSIKRMTHLASSSEIVFYFSLFGTICFFLLGLSHDMVWPNTTQWLWLLLLGFFASLAQVFVTKANSYAKASILAPFYYSNIVFASLFSYLFWGDILSYLGVLGTILIIGSGIILSITQYQRS